MCGITLGGEETLSQGVESNTVSWAYVYSPAEYNHPSLGWIGTFPLCLKNDVFPHPPNPSNISPAFFLLSLDKVYLYISYSEEDSLKHC